LSRFGVILCSAKKRKKRKKKKVDLNILHIGDKVKKNTKYCGKKHNSITPVI